MLGLNFRHQFDVGGVVFAKDAQFLHFATQLANLPAQLVDGRRRWHRRRRAVKRPIDAPGWR